MLRSPTTSATPPLLPHWRFIYNLTMRATSIHDTAVPQFQLITYSCDCTYIGRERNYLLYFWLLLLVTGQLKQRSYLVVQYLHDCVRLPSSNGDIYLVPLFNIESLEIAHIIPGNQYVHKNICLPSSQLLAAACVDITIHVGSRPSVDGS